ncbi:MAG: 4-vinyl reductase [Gemmatimonadaceae bacterium]
MMEASSTQLVGVAVPTLRRLRSAILSSADTSDAVTALRDAGYAGGETIYAAFELWLVETGASKQLDAGALQLDAFGEQASKFFRDSGWGEVHFTHDEDNGVAMVDISKCWEAAGSDSADDPGCQITTGMLASFFGKIAGFPVAVLETECSHGADSRCRFLLGNADTMNHQWNEMQAGT